MPIYEFYCPDCHTVFNFLSRTINTTRRPDCPRCSRPKLDRRMSRFAISKNRPEPSGEDDMLPDDFDEAKMERVMEELAREADGMNEDDPRQMARMMRKLCDATGMPVDDRMEEAIKRLESGEDPEAVEEDMGDLFDEDGPMPGMGEPKGSRVKSLAKRLRPPNVDETLYDL